MLCEISINDNSKTAHEILPKLILYNYHDVLYNIRHTIAVDRMYNKPILKNAVFALTHQRWAPNAIHEILYLDKILTCTPYLIPHRNTSQMIPHVSNSQKKLKSYANLNIKLLHTL